MTRPAYARLRRCTDTQEATGPGTSSQVADRPPDQRMARRVRAIAPASLGQMAPEGDRGTARLRKSRATVPSDWQSRRHHSADTIGTLYSTDGPHYTFITCALPLLA